MTAPALAPARGLLVIVNFEQAREIGAFLENVRKHFQLEHCVVVDDGSRDGSDRMAEQAGFRLLRHGANLGVGAAIRTGLRYAQKAGYRWVVISAANGKMLPNEFYRLYEPVDRGEADYVQGNRFMDRGASPGLPLFRRVMIPVFSLFTSILLGKWFGDITCGLRAYDLKILDDPSIDLDQPWLDRYELEYYLHYRVVKSKRWHVIEVPVTMRYEQLAPGRQSKIKPFSGWWSMIRPFVILALRIRK